MDWSTVVVVVAALALWMIIVRFVLPRFGIKGG